MKAELASFPSFGVDTVQVLTAEACRFLVRNGFSFAVRYIGERGIKADELRRILCSGLAFMPVTFSRGAGWRPSAAAGESDGAAAVQSLAALGIPRGATVWLDLEGAEGPREQAAAWVDAWADVVAGHAYMAGLYVGAQPGGLGPAELWGRPKITRYWKSCSKVPEPDVRGFCMHQLSPFNARVGPLTVDVDAICDDWRGDRPHWVVE